MQLCREQAAPSPGNREFVVPVQLCAGAAALRLAHPPCAEEPCQRRGSGEEGGLPRAQGNSPSPQLCGGSGEPRRQQGRKLGWVVQTGLQGWAVLLAPPPQLWSQRGGDVAGGKRLEVHL